MAKRMIDYWLVGKAAVTAMHEQSPSRWWQVKYLDFSEFSTARLFKNPSVLYESKWKTSCVFQSYLRTDHLLVMRIFIVFRNVNFSSMVLDTCFRTVSQQSWPVMKNEDQWCLHRPSFWVRVFTLKFLNLTHLIANISLSPTVAPITPFPPGIP